MSFQNDIYLSMNVTNYIFHQGGEYLTAYDFETLALAVLRFCKCPADALSQITRSRVCVRPTEQHGIADAAHAAGHYTES